MSGKLHWREAIIFASIKLLSLKIPDFFLRIPFLELIKKEQQNPHWKDDCGIFGVHVQKTLAGGRALFKTTTAERASQLLLFFFFQNRKLKIKLSQIWEHISHWGPFDFSPMFGY